MFSFLSKLFSGGRSNEPIALALPDPVTMIYGAYFRAEPGRTPSPGDLKAEIVSWLDRFNEPFGPALKGWIEKDLLTILVSPEAEVPPAPVRLLKAMGIGEEEDRRFSEATHVAIFSSPDRLQFPRLGLWAALAAARAVSDSRDGVVIDTVIPRILRDAPFDEEFPDNLRILIPRHIIVPFSRDRRGLCWMTTKGMSKFGLPELEIVDVPPNLPDSLVPVMNGLAWILVKASISEFNDDDLGEKTFKIGPEIPINTRDIAEAHGGEEPAEPVEGVRGWSTIRLEYRPGKRGGESYLRLVPPRHFKEGRGVWLHSLLVDLLGVKREILQVADDDEVMASAHEKAVATLPEFKKRFQRGPELGHLFFVKHGFPRKDNSFHEFMWVVVKTWSGGWIEGILANEPRHRIDLRSGQTVTLNEDDVFDWLITMPDGTQEGGFTNIAAAEQGHAEEENDDQET